ncbi:TRAP transporter permease, partial [Calditrichota bacterium]
MPDDISTDQSQTTNGEISPEDLIQEIAGPRHLDGWQNYLVIAIAFSWSAFQLSLGSILLLNSTLIRSIHLAFAMGLVFISYPLFRSGKLGKLVSVFSRKDKFHPLEIVIAIVAALAALYIALDYTGIAERIGSPIPRDRVIGILLF